MCGDLAIAVLTPRATDLGLRLVTAIGRGEVIDVSGSAREHLSELFLAGRPLVCVMALGIVVRILGPLTRDKVNDPPVVVVDEAGRFAISVLGGHAGGANELTHQVAKALGAQAVVTTATDALGLPAIDLLGLEWGWKIEQRDNLTRLSALIVRGESIGVYQDVGRRDWWQSAGVWPDHFRVVDTWPPSTACAGWVIISDRVWPIPPEPTVILRPPSLVLGVGCRRGVPCTEIEVAFANLCETQRLSPLNFGGIASATLKADEPGLLEFANRHGLTLQTFTVEELSTVSNLPTPSAIVHSKIGVFGVCEPAALLAAKVTQLLVPKVRTERVTMAVARRDDI
jgi:cobalt-precorrin 5A hydrolase